MFKMNAKEYETGVDKENTFYGLCYDDKDIENFNVFPNTVLLLGGSVDVISKVH